MQTFWSDLTLPCCTGCYADLFSTFGGWWRLCPTPGLQAGQCIDYELR